ncbi:hypothetical protein GCM10027447_20010 [Glycomyces halotolerans]
MNAEGKALAVDEPPGNLAPDDPASAVLFRMELEAAGIDIDHEVEFVD